MIFSVERSNGASGLDKANRERASKSLSDGSLNNTEEMACDCSQWRAFQMIRNEHHVTQVKVHVCDMTGHEHWIVRVSVAYRGNCCFAVVRTLDCKCQTEQRCLLPFGDTTFGSC